MRLLTAFFLLFTFATTSFGQIKYEKGYFINNDNKRIECLIKNTDWKNNPNHFIYKLDDSSTPIKGNLNSVKEFGIYDICKFISTNVKIDRSKTQAHGLSDNPEPFWWQEKLFLKVLVDGKAKLYCYDSSNGKKFFYSVTDSSINQLVFKEYQIGSKVVQNDTFKDQLWLDLKYPDVSIDLVSNINYTSEELEKYFNSYNKFMGDTITQMDIQTKVNNKIERNYFNLKLAPGINASGVSMQIMKDFPNLIFKQSQGSRVGLEAELILPFNMNKWGIVIEPCYQSINSVAENGGAIIKFNSIEFPIGIRYYLHLDDRNRFYVDGFYISSLAINFNSSIRLYSDTYLDISTASNLAFGGGFEHKRLSLGTRYYTDRNLLRKYISFHADYSRLAIILGYKIVYARHH